jgi:uncharacterized membrane protein
MKNNPEREQTNDSIIDADYRVLHRNIGITSTRLEGLSDAIYAVAMTLLILDLRLPTDVTEKQLPGMLYGLVPNLTTYALSFMTLGVLWTAHVIQSHWLVHISRTYIWMKIVFLMFIVLIPFSTQILSANGYEKFGVALYGLNYLACTALLLLLWIYATNEHRLVRSNLSAHVIIWLRARLLVANMLAVIALAVAMLFSTRAGAALFIGAQVLVIFPTIGIDKVIAWIVPHLKHAQLQLNEKFR